MPDDLDELRRRVHRVAGELALEPRARRPVFTLPHVLPPGTGTSITTLTWRQRVAQQLRTMFTFWRKK